ncbi:MAG: Fic family protein [Nitrospiria bacterium]
MNDLSEKEIEFLRESNAIEDMRSEEALEYAKKSWCYIMSLQELSSNTVLEVHRLLMNRINPRIAGQLRDGAVRIGGHIKKYRGREFLLSQLRDVVDQMNVSIKEPKTEEDELAEISKKLHVQFESAHVFEDGNGRVGRILWNWHRRQFGLPIEIIHEGEEQRKYYHWFD